MTDIVGQQVLVPARAPAQFLICRALCRGCPARLLFKATASLFMTTSRTIPSNRLCRWDRDLTRDWATPLPATTLGSASPLPCSLREVVPPHCLAYVRFLELVFPPMSHNHWPKPEHPAVQDWWCATVDWLRDKINGPGLTMWLIMAHLERDIMDDPPDRTDMTVPQGKAVIRSYIDILRPLKHLAVVENGLARFYAQCARPWMWTQAAYVRMSQPDGCSWLKSKERELKDCAERFVMGDRYDTLYAGGDGGPNKSTWQFPPDPYT